MTQISEQAQRVRTDCPQYPCLTPSLTAKAFTGLSHDCSHLEADTSSATERRWSLKHGATDMEQDEKGGDGGVVTKIRVVSIFSPSSSVLTPEVVVRPQI